MNTLHRLCYLQDETRNKSGQAKTQLFVDLPLNL